MDITFKTKEIRSICENSDIAEERFGKEVAKSLRTRLADLSAAPYLNHMPTDYLREGNSPGVYLIDLYENFTLGLTIKQFNDSYMVNDEIDSGKVYRIMILSIEGRND